MTWRDASQFGLRNLRRRGVRTLLTGLAIALGTALLVALLTIAATADTRIVSQLSKGGPAAAIHVDDAVPTASSLDSDTLQSGQHRDIGDRELQAIRRAPHVASVVPVLSIPAFAVPCPPAEMKAEGAHLKAACIQQTNPFGATLVGADLSQLSNLPVTVLAGRVPRPGSMTEVAVSAAYFDRLGIKPTQTAQVLGTEIELATPQLIPGSTAGRGIRFRGRWFRAQVVGVVAQSVENGDFLVPIQQTQLARQWALGGPPAPDALGPVTTKYSALVVVADSLANVHAVRQEIADIGYATAAPEHLVASVQKYLHVVDIVLGGIGAIALAIAALGVANSLLAAVRERWREIGVLKAIGAADHDVLRWFLVEAGVLGLIGGLIGSAAGFAVALSVGLAANDYLTQQGLDGIDLLMLPPNLVLVAPIATTALALLAGSVPALRAARLPAREALGGI
jgi:putative ABC transport system permease protein